MKYRRELLEANSDKVRLDIRNFELVDEIFLSVY